MNALARLNRRLWNESVTCLNDKRSFYMWLNFVFNRVDEGRIEEFGPDRVAAEWILRCGGGVKFKNIDRWLWDYNSIPDGPKQKLALEGINAKGIAITTGGLRHLVGLQHLTELNMNSCRYATDMGKLLAVKGTLLHLDIGNCRGISDVSPLKELKKLKTLNLVNTPGIQGRDEAITSLQQILKDCEITA